MGNTNSNTNSDAEDDEQEEEIQCKEKDSNADIEGNLDLNILFQPSWLREVACKIKEDASDNPLQQHSGTLQKWLEDRKSRGEETVTIGQFTDFFANRGIDKKVAVEMFHQFDIEGDGIIDVELFQEILAEGSSSNILAFRNDLQSVNKLMQDCLLTPAFVDAFTDHKTAVETHGRRLSKFLGRNRAPCQALALPALESFLSTTEMRLKVLQAHLASMKEKAESKKKEPPVQGDEILKPITRCFTSVEVSTNRNDFSKLIDGDPKTFWQSDGPARSHWIRLRIPPNVVIKQLSINVASSDQSYMPQHVVVSGGRDGFNLRELNETKIPSHFTGDHVLLENLKTPFPVIQIGIKRCHSDGCDTRVRQVKAVGYRVIKSRGVSILDATSMWYLSVLASTAAAAIPIAPQLPETIINHTRMALLHMQPLTLSSASAERPGFLSPNVLEQMEQFLQSLVCLGPSPRPRDIAVLVEFSLARGSLGSILGILRLVFEQRAEHFKVTPFLKNIREVQERAIRKHGSKLQVTLTACDGGSKDESSGPQNVLTEDWQEAYFTAQGKKTVTMAFSLKNDLKLQLTRLFIKVSKGVTGADSGLVFVVDVKDSDKDDKDGQLSELVLPYQSWTGKDYKEFMNRVKEGHIPEEHDPVSFFQLDKEWDDIDIMVDRIQTGNCVIIMFLGPRNETAERIGILGVSLYGYEWTEDVNAEQKELEKLLIVPNDDHETVSGDLLFLHILRFLELMSWDTTRLRSQSVKDQMFGDKDPSLDIQDVSIKDLWDLYKLVKDGILENNTSYFASVLLLNIFFLALPFLKPGVQKARDAKKTGKDFSDEGASQEVMLQISSQVLEHLYYLVDDRNIPKMLHKLAKDIILDGAEVFFPDAAARKEHLLSLIDQVMKDERAISLSYTFESLCRFFSNRDASGLLGLPEPFPKANFHPEPVIHVMRTLVSVAFRECRNQVKTKAWLEESSSIVQLLCSMQKSLLAWCYSYCASGDKEVKSIALSLLTQYLDLMGSMSTSAMQIVKASDDKSKVIDSLEYSFLSLATRQLVLFLNLFANLDIPCNQYLQFLYPLAMEIKAMVHEIPEQIYQPDSGDWKKKEEDIVLRTWEAESPHNYANNSQEKMVFTCAGCTSFRVEFDRRCETERRYDYLEFTDSKGGTRRFDQSVGTEKWPQEVTFDAGQKLYFVFHSDGSNNEWGYKFKVSALGRPYIAMSWIFDLQLNLARLFGTLCSNALDCRRALGVQSEHKDSCEERALLHSELWSSLFRGGYLVGKLERSLSGFHGTNPSDSSLNSYLNSIASGDGRGADLIEKLKKNSNGLAVGGPLVDGAVRAVFAALVWHTQELREQVAPFAVDDDLPENIPAGIQQAYNAAEDLRRNLLETRQKLLVEAEDAKTSPEAREVKDPDTPVISCQQKAVFLLKFAGLSRLPRRLKEAGHSTEKKSSFLNRRSWHRQDSGEPRRQIRFGSDIPNVHEKYPTFKMVTEFVMNGSLSHERIHALLQQRCKYANTVASMYTFASDFLGSAPSPDIFQAPAVLFLQQLLLQQQNFPRHYADYLNGCGLELENKVRKAFYSLIKKLTEGVLQTMQGSLPTKSTLVFEFARAYLLHLLDIDWKPYDHAFIEDISLPQLLLQTSESTARYKPQNTDDVELEMYQQHQEFFKEARDTSIGAWCERYRNSAPRDVQRNMNLFIARFSDQLDVIISCDGCETNLRGRRYRCLNCVDMDLCSNCYSSGVKPKGHSDYHEVIDLRYKCDNCDAFIVGTRIHCNECQDFDLCLGCHKSENFPSHHKASHEICRVSMNHDFGASRPNGTLQSYIHHHSWLQFASLALSLSEAIQEKKTTSLDAEYNRTAYKILMSCFEKSVAILSVATAKMSESGQAGATEETPLTVSAEEPPPPEPAKFTEITSTTDTTLSTEGTPAPEAAIEAESLSSAPEPDPPNLDGEGNPLQPPMIVRHAEGEDQSDFILTIALNGSSSVVHDRSPTPPNCATSNGNSEAVTQQLSSLGRHVEGSLPFVSFQPPLSLGTAMEEDETQEMPSLEEITSVVVPKEKEESTATEEHQVSYFSTGSDSLFAMMSLNRVLGLLGALMPTSRQLAAYPDPQVFLDFVSSKLVPALCDLINCKDGLQKMKIQGLGVLCKALKCIPPKVADGGFKNVAETTKSDISTSCPNTEGSVTIEFLFHVGAHCLERADLDMASGIESVLKQLSCTGNWQNAVASHATSCLQMLADNSSDPSLTSLFALVVLAGFPDVYRTGMLANVVEASGETKKVVVLEHSQEKGTADVCNLKTRKKMVVKEHQLENIWSWYEGVDSSRIRVLLRIIQDILLDKKESKPSVERKWGLALGLKALLGNLKAGMGSEEVQEIINSGALPLLVNLACQGTGFSKQWLLRDLEVLSWKLYGMGKDHEAKEVKETEDTQAAKTEDDSKVSSTSVAKTEIGGPLEGLDEEMRKCFQTIHDALRCEYPIIRAIFERVGRDREKLLGEVQRSFDGEGFKISDDVKELARQWEQDTQDDSAKETEKEDASLDLGVLRFTPKPIEHKDLEAKPESGENHLKLITSMTEAEIYETRAQQRRGKSSELLRVELESTQRSFSKDFVRKVNHAVCVGYSRRLLAWLFSVWPENQEITQMMLNAIDACKIVGLLDLIQSIESTEVFEKVVYNFVRSCNGSLVQPLALSAVHCMGDVRLASETRESEHKYKDNTKMEGKVHIPGATSLFIRFDERCSTEHTCDELTLSSSPNLQLNQRVFSGQAEWQDFELPGDTVYFKFTSDSSNNDWGWRFTVTGGQLGRFETACAILNSLLAQDIRFARSLPLSQLWSWLIVVACNQIGQQRLMATGLLLRILQIAAGENYLFEEELEPLPVEQRPDLNLLRPLWSLYSRSIESDTGTSLALVSPVIRGLSELFLVVENIAQDWNIAADLIAGLASDEKLRQCFTRAVGNIAAIATAIGIPSKAIELLKNAPTECSLTQRTPHNAASTEQVENRSSTRRENDAMMDSSLAFVQALTGLFGLEDQNEGAGNICLPETEDYDDQTSDEDDEEDEDDDEDEKYDLYISNPSTPEQPF